MSGVTKKESATELTVTDRAGQILKFDERKAQLAELAKVSERIVEITNTAGYQECHAARMDLKNTRIDIQKVGKDAREEATAFSKAVIAKEKVLIGIIEPEEARLQKIQDEWDAAREAERQAKVRAEQERIAAIERERIAAEQAEAARIQREREEAMAAERAELDRQRKELEQEQAEQRRIVAERERVEREQREVAETAHREQLRKEREEQEAKLAEDRKRVQAERDELERLQAEQRRVAREQADRNADAERKRLDDEAKARREQLARDLETAKQKRLENLKANAPALRVAAIAACHLLVGHGLADDDVTIQLGFAIEQDAKAKTTKKAA